MKGPEFSVIIPTKNEEENIKKLLESLNQQELQPKEVIVADDSTDKTREVAKSYGATIVQGVSNGLIGIARNRAAKAATSDILIFLDADNILPPGFLRKLVYRFLADDLDLASCYLSGNRRRIRSTLYFESWNALKKFGSMTRKIIAESGICMIVKKSTFDKVGGFPEDIRVGEDTYLAEKIVKNGGKYKIIPVKIKTSDRRVAISPPRMAVQLVGLAGIATIGFVGWNLLKKNRHRFEKMYGKTGGRDKTDEKKKKFLGIF